MLSAQSYLTLATPWTVARQAPLSMGFLRQEYWRGLPFPSQEGLPDPSIELVSLASQINQGFGEGMKLSWRPPPLACMLKTTG